MRIGSSTSYLPQQTPQRAVASSFEGTLFAANGDTLPLSTPPQAKWELWDKEKFLEIGRPDIILSPEIRNNFGSPEEIDGYLAKSNIGISVTLGNKTVGYLLSDFVDGFGLSAAKSLVATIKSDPHFPQRPIKDPGKKPENILKAVQDFVQLNFKGHAEKNYYLRLMVLDGKRVVNLAEHLDSTITVSPEVDKILYGRIHEIENTLYTSYQNITGRLVEAKGEDHRLWMAYLVFITGEASPKQAKDKFLKGAGRYLHLNEGAEESKNSEIIVHAAKEQISRQWFKSAPAPVVAQAPAPAAKPAEPTPAPVPAPTPAPSGPQLDVIALANKTAKPRFPSLFALTPQKGGQELLSVLCSGKRTSEDKDNFILEQDRCSLGGQTVSVALRSDFNAKSGNWAPWEYKIEGTTTKGTAQDIGLLIYTNGTHFETFPYQTNKEMETKLANFLFPQYHFPQATILSFLDYSDQREKVRKSSCALEKKDVKTFLKDEDHLEGIGNEYLCKSYFTRDKPSLMAPFISQQQGSATLYRLGTWVLTRPGSPTGAEIADNRQVGFPKKSTEAPFLFTDDSDLFHQLTDRVFLEAPAIETMVSRYGEDYGRVYNHPSDCQLGNIATDENAKVQTIDGQCQFRSGEATSLKLTRHFDIEPSDDETIFSVSDWSLNIQDHDQNISRTVSPDNKITLVPGTERGVDILQHETEEERIHLLDARYQSNVGDKYFPKVLVLRGALSYVNSNFASSTFPTSGERHSETAESFHNTAAANSAPNNSANQGDGALFNLQSEVYLGSLVGAPIGGPFAMAGITAGQAGRYNDKSLNIAEVQGGLGVALREIFGWEEPFDISLRALFLRKTLYSGDESLIPTKGFKSPLFGGCLVFGKLNTCFDYSRDVMSKNNLEMFRFSLGYDFFKIENRPHVKIGE